MSFNSSKISALTGAAGATGATGASGSGSGDVVKVGTPVNNQVGVWTGDGTLEGDADLIFDGTNLGIGAGSDPDHPLHIGTSDFVVTSAGNCGIGTNLPDGKMEVEETGSGHGAGGILSRTVGADGNAGIRFGTAGTDRWSISTIGTAGADLRFRDLNAGATRMTITSAGLVGIGVAVPASLLHLSDDFGSSETGGIYISNNGTATADDLSPIGFTTRSSSWGTIHAATIAAGTASASVGGAYLKFSTASTGQYSPTERMRITSAGNVVIGAAAAGVKLGVVGAIHSFGTGVTPSATSGFQLAAASSNNNGYLWNFEDADILFGANNIERMRIDSAGNAGIGTAVPTSDIGFTRILHLAHANAVGIKFEATNYNSWEIGTGTSSEFIIADGGVARVNVDSSGNLKLPTGKLILDENLSEKTIWCGGYGGGILMKRSDASSDRYAKFGILDGSGVFVSGITVDTAGLVGINVSDPDSELEINGQIKITGGSPGAAKVLTSDGDGLATWEAAGGGGGKVLQVLNNTATVSDASDTSATAAVSQAITPAADSNTVLITAIANFSLPYDETYGEEGDMRWRLYRGSTALGNEQKYVNGNDAASWTDTSLYFCCSFTFKDSPATASAVTYSLKYYHANTNTPAAVVYDAQITVQEID